MHGREEGVRVLELGNGNGLYIKDFTVEMNEKRLLKIVYISHPDLLSTKSVLSTIDRGTSSVKITILSSLI